MLTVAYDGTNYCGWQIQDNGIAVEEVINKELDKLLGEEIHVIGASRTDSGVHALGNVCVFDTDTRIPPEKLSFALNAGLPEDIRIVKSEEVEADFHPRHCSSIKTYEYHIWNYKFMNPVLNRFCKFVYYDLDIEAMRNASKVLIGKHDFKSFCSAHSQTQTTIREIISIDINEVSSEKLEMANMPGGRLITIRVRGYGFLYNMVRIIVGTLLKVGMHMMKPDDMETVLEAKDRGAAGPKADAAGLTMVGIKFLE